MRTVASDDDSAQERFFARRVNFYGKDSFLFRGFGSRWNATARNGQFETGNLEESLNSQRLFIRLIAELYEVLQPFAWAVANGSQRKNGSATLYVRIRKDDQGQFHIIHLELRHS